jgi:DNA polymerase III subunit delta
MRLRFDQLAGHLQRPLAPVYLVCGEEPWQLGEAVRMVRACALGQGYEREVLDQEANFDWSALGAAADALSLFASRRLIELRLGAATLGQEGSAAIRRYCDRAGSDTVLLMVAPQLDRKDLKAKWAQEVERVGTLVQVWPLEGGRLVAWLGERLGAAGFRPTPGVAALLAERVEGNLLAAVQEIEKLRLLHDPGPLDDAGLLSAICDNARFDLFDLTDASLAGDRARVARVLGGLVGEGTAAPLVLWVLARELRLLAAAAFAQTQGRDAARTLVEQRVPEMRHPAILRAVRRLPLARVQALLRRCAEADRAIKGLAAADAWLVLHRIADGLAGGPPEDWDVPAGLADAPT